MGIVRRDDVSPTLGKYSFAEVRDMFLRFEAYGIGYGRIFYRDGTSLFWSGTFESKMHEQDQRLCRHRLCTTKGQPRDEKWAVTVTYCLAGTEPHDIIRSVRFRGTGRSFSDQEVPLIAKHIQIDTSLSWDVVADDLGRVYDRLVDAELKTTTLEDWANSGYGMLIQCPCCYRVKLTAPELARKFDLTKSIEEVKSQLKCVQCGQKSRPTLRPDLSDQTDA